MLMAVDADFESDFQSVGDEVTLRPTSTTMTTRSDRPTNLQLSDICLSALWCLLLMHPTDAAPPSLRWCCWYFSASFLASLQLPSKHRNWLLLLQHVWQLFGFKYMVFLCRFCLSLPKGREFLCFEDDCLCHWGGSSRFVLIYCWVLLMSRYAFDVHLNLTANWCTNWVGPFANCLWKGNRL